MRDSPHSNQVLGFSVLSKDTLTRSGETGPEKVTPPSPETLSSGEVLMPSRTTLFNGPRLSETESCFYY